MARVARIVVEAFALSSPPPQSRLCKRNTKGQQLKGKILSALFHALSHFSTLTFLEFLRIFSPRLSLKLRHPKGPRRTKNTTRSKFTTSILLVRRGDLLSRRTLCGHHFPVRRVHGALNLGGVVKTLRHSNSVFLLSS